MTSLEELDPERLTPAGVDVDALPKLVSPPRLARGDGDERGPSKRFETREERVGEGASADERRGDLVGDVGVEGVGVPVWRFELLDAGGERGVLYADMGVAGDSSPVGDVTGVVSIERARGGVDARVAIAANRAWRGGLGGGGGGLSSFFTGVRSRSGSGSGSA